MKKWTTKKIKTELLNGGIPKSKILMCMMHLQNILLIIKKRNLHSIVNFHAIIEQVIAGQQQQNVDKSLFFNQFFPEMYLKKISDEIDSCHIAHEFKFCAIPGKQKEFAVGEVALITRRTERTIRTDIDFGRLIAIKNGRRWSISRKSLFDYKKKMKK